MFLFFKLLFIENKGMAMGAKLNNIIPFLDDNTAKLILTIFRIFACIGIGFWLKSIIKNKGSQLLIICIFQAVTGRAIEKTQHWMLHPASTYKKVGLRKKRGVIMVFYTMLYHNNQIIK